MLSPPAAALKGTPTAMKASSAGSPMKTAAMKSSEGCDGRGTKRKAGTTALAAWRTGDVEADYDGNTMLEGVTQGDERCLFKIRRQVDNKGLPGTFYRADFCGSNHADGQKGCESAWSKDTPPLIHLCTTEDETCSVRYPNRGLAHLWKWRKRPHESIRGPPRSRLKG